MDIPLFEEGVPLRFERIVLYPYPDLKRVWTRVWLTAVQDQKPNIEIVVLDRDGSENTSVYMMEHAEQRAETTLHIRDGQAGGLYHVVAELTMGLSDKPELLQREEFDLLLEFRDPEQDAGFGFGVDWDEIRRKRQGDPS